MHAGYWWESQKERCHQEDQDVGELIILKWVLKKQDRVSWTGLIWRRIRTSGRLF
jgi:hypothetical protein